MDGDTQEDSVAQPNKPIRRKPLSGWERGAAFVFGTGLTGAGATSVFLSTNQAGSGSLVILGAALLLVGIQGTPITKASKDSVEWDRREVAEQLSSEARQKANDGDARAAKAFIDGAVAADPALAVLPAVRSAAAEIRPQEAGELYAAAVLAAINRIAPELNLFSRPRQLDFGSDIEVAHGETLFGVQVKYLGPKVTSASELIEMAQAAVARSLTPTLMVANRKADIPALREVHGIPMAFAAWRTAAEDATLRDTINLLIDALEDRGREMA